MRISKYHLYNRSELTTGIKRKHHTWTVSELEALRLTYGHTLKSERLLANRYNVSCYQVRQQLSRMGLFNPTARIWTDEENETLITLMGHYCPEIV